MHFSSCHRLLATLLTNGLRSGLKLQKEVSVINSIKFYGSTTNGYGSVKYKVRRKNKGVSPSWSFVESRDEINFELYIYIPLKLFFFLARTGIFYFGIFETSSEIWLSFFWLFRKCDNLLTLLSNRLLFSYVLPYTLSEIDIRLTIIELKLNICFNLNSFETAELLYCFRKI